MLSLFKKNSIKKYCILLLAITITNVYPQEIQNNYNIRLNPNLSNQWWSQYNNYGQKNTKIKLNYKGNYQTKIIDYSFAISASKDKFYIGESFLKSRLSDETYLKVGRYYRDFSSYLNDNLSSGSMLISNNAEPMPKIGLLSSYKFKKNKKFDLSFGISHAVFEKDKFYNSSPMLHEKFIYLNYANKNNKFSFGFVHEAMWGGNTDQYGKFPSSFKDFLKVFISEDGPWLEGEPHANALGNHLGIWDFYYERKIDYKILKVYYQHFFEDTSGLRFTNRIDGLWGLELENYIPKTNLLIEYLSTTDQDRTRHNDAYYNHYQYNLGWSYKGYTLGNPFIKHLTVEPIRVLHLAINSESDSTYYYQLRLARKVNISDKLKYELIMTKRLDQKNQSNISNISVYILNNENMGHEIGFGISRQF